MTYLVLARKYRPQSFEGVVEQDHVTRTLKNAIAADRVAHAILFSGPRGTGKTTVARILAKAMNCRQGPATEPCNACRSCAEITEGRSADVFEIDGASNNSVDQVRELRDNCRYMPVSSRFKIYIIDEVHMLSAAAFNALLKTLEEPPAHVMFLFATTEPHKIPVTIHSRCQRYDMRRVPMDALVGHLKHLCEREEARLPEESLVQIAREAGGSIRDALSLLDQVLTCSADDITHEQVLDILGAVDRTVIHEMGGALLSAELPVLLRHLQALHDRGHDLRKLYGDLLAFFRNLLVVRLEPGSPHLVDLPVHEREEMVRLAAPIDPAGIQQVFDLLYREESAIRLSAHPKLAFELALMRICRMRPALSIDELIEKVDALRTAIAQGRGAIPPSDAPAPGPPTDPRAEERVPAEDSPVRNQAAAETPAAEEAPEILWERACRQLSKEYPALAAGLRKARLLGVDGRRIDIQVEGSAFVIGRIKRKESLDSVAEVCSAHFGRPMEIVLHEKALEKKRSNEKKNRERRLRNEALGSPIVAEAIELFEGKVLGVKVFDGPESP